MASGEEIDDLVKRHDEVVDHVCTLCAKRGKKLEAEFYCGKCKQYLCLNCESVHQSLLSDHKVSGKLEKSSWGVSAVEEQLIEQCGQHSGKEIELFCVTHQALCCCVCISMKHRTCENVQYIPEAAKKFSTGEELPKTTDDAKATIAKLQKVKADRENSKKKLIKSKENFKIFSKNVEEKFVKRISMLQKNAEVEMEKMFTELDRDLQADVETCDEYLRDLKKMSQDPSTASFSDIQRFIHTKRMQTRSSEGTTQLEKMSSRILKDHFLFKTDSKLEKVIEDTTNLGKFEAFVPGSQEEETLEGQSEVNTQENHESLQTKSDVHYVHSIKQRQVCKTYYDNGCYDITPIFAQKQKGELYCVASGRLYSVILGTSKMTGKSVVTMSGSTALCFIAGNDLAVTSSDTAVLVCKFTGLTVTKSKKFSVKSCNWIRSRGNSLYTFSTSDMKIYTGLEIVDGHIVAFDTDICTTVSLRTFLSVQDVEVSMDGKLVYIADECSGLVTMDTRGNVLSRLHDECLIGVTGVCVGRDEKVFVLNKRTRQVLQVDKYGTIMEGVVADGLKDVHQRIFYYTGVNEDSLFIMHGGDSSEILVLKLA